MIDELNVEIATCEADLRRLGADHPSIPLLLSVAGVGPLLAYTMASEIGDIGRFESPKKLAGYTWLCPIVRQSGPKDRRGPLAKNSPKYLRWAPIGAATHAARDPRYRDRYRPDVNRAPSPYDGVLPYQSMY
jgi:transposase